MPSEELAPDELSALLSSYMPEIPGYRVLRRIGRGGMSYVYLGVQVSLDRQVAVKVMAPEALADEKTKQRFEQEARMIAKLEHPNIVGIHEVGRSPQGLMYYVLPYLAKGHLGQRDFTHDEARATEVLRALLSALEYAHARGIVHRDVKAENVLFDNADRPLLTDFGIALSKRDNTRITTAGLAIGSGGYMAPEQARGESVDGRADLYSIGVLAYELVTGQLPYQSGDQLGLALMHAQDPIPRLPPEKKHWQPFIDRAMAKSPDNRYRNAQQMLSALNQIASRERAGSDSGAVVSLLSPAAALRFSPPRTPANRSWRLPLLIGMPAVALLVLAFLLLRPHSSEPREPDFFTARDTDKKASTAPPAPPPVVAPAAPQVDSPVVANAPDASVAPAAVEPPVVVSAAPVASGIASATAFANVTGQVSVTTLDYDPTLPGMRELSAARRQLKQNRLSTPPGDNAMESLLAAHRLVPGNADAASLGDNLISAFGSKLSTAISSGHDDVAKAAYQRAAKFTKDSSRRNSPAWLALRASLAPLLTARLEASTRAHDYTAIGKSKRLALALELTQQDLEPAWSRADVVPELPKVGELLNGSGPAMILATAPSETRPGLAVMREEVSRGEYASFVASSHHAAAKCGNALQALFGSKHHWDDPGITQTNEHPVVCVSQADARAYADWLSQRTGKRYRLPTQMEWRAIADYRGGDPCRSGKIACGNGNQHSTAPGSGYAPSPLGIQDLRGNVSEWLADGAGGGRYLSAGLSWRDTPSSSPLRNVAHNGDRGFDDVGFRLVREVGLRDLGNP